MKKIWQNLPGFFPSPKAYLSSLVHYNPKSKDARIWELDVLRGLVILYLTFDGFCRIIFRFPISWQTEFGKGFYSFLVQYNGGAFQSGVNPFVNYFLCFLSGITTCLTGSPLRKTGRFALFYLACWGTLWFRICCKSIATGTYCLIFLPSLPSAICYGCFWMSFVVRRGCGRL